MEAFKKWKNKHSRPGMRITNQEDVWRGALEEVLEQVNNFDSGVRVIDWIKEELES